MMICLHCGAEVPENSKFCLTCGKPLAEEKKPACPHCGAEVPENSKFCLTCGKPLAEEKPQPAAAPQPDAAPQPNAAQQSSSNAAQQPYAQPAQYGTRQNPSPGAAQQPYAQPQNAAYVGAFEQLGRCKGCKQLIPADAAQCPHCGSHDINRKPDLWVGVFALIFGILGGWLSIPFGIYGLNSAKKTRYTPVRVMSIIGMVLCAAWWIFIWLVNS